MNEFNQYLMEKKLSPLEPVQFLNPYGLTGIHHIGLIYFGR